MTEEKKIQQIAPTRMRLAESKRLAWFAVAEPGQQPDDLLNPAVWAHHARDLGPWARIEVVADDGTWWAEYIVLDVSRTWAKVHKINDAKLTTSDVSMSEVERFKAAGYEIRHRGQHYKWSVIRLQDKAAVHEGATSQDEAAGWLRNHLKVVMK